MSNKETNKETRIGEGQLKNDLARLEWPRQSTKAHTSATDVYRCGEGEGETKVKAHLHKRLESAIPAVRHSFWLKNCVVRQEK